MKKVTQAQFDEAAALFDQIAVLQNQLAKAKRLGTKIMLRRHIIALVAKRRVVLGLEKESEE